MAQTKQELQTDLDRIQVMIKKARDTGNQDTDDILGQAESRIEGAIEVLSRDSRATRQASIDAANAELIAFENERRVSVELKAAIQDSRGDLVNRRKNV